MKVLVTQLCLILCDHMDCRSPGSSVHGILQARILECVAISFSRRSSQTRDWTRLSCTAGRLFTHWATRETLLCRRIILISSLGKKKEWKIRKSLFLQSPEFETILTKLDPYRLALLFPLGLLLKTKFHSLQPCMILTSDLLRVKRYIGHIYLTTLLIFSYFVIMKNSQGQLWNKIIKESKNGGGLHHRQGNGWQCHPWRLNGFSGPSISIGLFRTCTTSSSNQRFMDSLP